MLQTPDYKRGYQNGYNAGTREIREIRAQAWQEVEAASHRAEHAERASGVGHCDGCMHWSRGGHGCVWGHCAAAHGTLYGVPWMRADAESTGITTSERFGCVLFVPMQEAPDEPAR